MCISNTARKCRSCIQLPAPVQDIIQKDAFLESSSYASSSDLETTQSKSYTDPTDILDYSGDQTDQVRGVVQHDYHDHATETPADEEIKQLESADDPNGELSYKPPTRGGVTTPFPFKLHEMLERIEQDGLAHVVSWQPHGRCFVVHEQKEFVEQVMPTYFRQTKFPSFLRQLNLYGFSRLTKGPDKGGYYHELFLRGKPFLCERINRMKVKGTGARMASNPEAEPNFYAMPPVCVQSSPQVQVPTPPPLMTGMPRRLPGSVTVDPCLQHPRHQVVPPSPPPIPTQDRLLLSYFNFLRVEPVVVPRGSVAPELPNTTTAIAETESTLQFEEQSPILPIPEPVSNNNDSEEQQQPARRPAPIRISSIVSDDDDEDDQLLPVSDEQVAAFFAEFDMPFDLDEEEEKLQDETSFGYLLEYMLDC